MRTIKMLFVLLVMVGLASSAWARGYRTYAPSWDMNQGQIANYAKGHEVTVSYKPVLIRSYDKRHQLWSQSTLKPQNLRREGEKDFLVETGKLLSNIFSKK